MINLNSTCSPENSYYSVSALQPLEHENLHLHLPSSEKIPTQTKAEIKATIAFFELTKRMFKMGSTDIVDQVAKVAFVEKLKKFNNREADLTTLLQALSEGDLKHRAFENLDDMAHLALWGVWKGLIGTIEFSNLMIVRLGLLYYDDLTFVPLFNASDVNPDSRKIIDDSIQNAPVPFLTMAETDTVFSHLAQDPAQAFMLVGREKEPLRPDNIIPAITNILRSNILDRTDNKKKKILPCLNLMQAVVDVRSNDPGFKFNPVIGPSSYSQIGNNGLFANRDVMLSFPGFNTPPKPHSLSAYGFDFIYHEFYHNLLSSSCSRSMQTTLIFFSQVLFTLTLTPEYESIKQLIIKKLYDMETSAARRENYKKTYSDEKLNQAELTLNVLNSFVASSIRKRFEVFDKSTYNKYFQVLTALFCRLRDLKNSGLDWDDELEIDLLSIYTVIMKKMTSYARSEESNLSDVSSYGYSEDSEKYILYNALLNSGLCECALKDQVLDSQSKDLGILNMRPLYLQHLSYKDRNNFDTVKLAVSKKGQALKFASLSMRSNREIVEAAVKNFGGAIKYASSELQDDYDIVMMAGSHKKSANYYDFVSLRLKTFDNIKRLFHLTDVEKDMNNIKLILRKFNPANPPASLNDMLKLQAEIYNCSSSSSSSSTDLNALYKKLNEYNI